MGRSSIAGSWRALLLEGAEPTRLVRLMYLNNREKVRMRFDDGSGAVDLSVTDVRFVGDDLTTPAREVVQRISIRLRTSDEMILSVGLGRPYCPPNDDGPQRHWLQVHNVFFAEDPLWQP